MGVSIDMDIQWILYIGIALFPIYLLIIGIQYLLKKNKLISHPLFDHLVIHYSQRTDTPETLKPARPRYVVNLDTNKAYWIPDFLEPYIKDGSIENWNSHDGETALNNFLEKRGIKIIKDNPRLEQIKLIRDRDDDLILEPDIISLLRGKKIENIKIVYLFPWFYRFLPFPKRNPPGKRLLLKYPKETEKSIIAYNPPLYDLILVEKEIIPCDTYTFRYPLDNLTKWCERNKIIRDLRPVNWENLSISESRINLSDDDDLERAR